jgi:hypothetical protein
VPRIRGHRQWFADPMLLAGSSEHPVPVWRAGGMKCLTAVLAAMLLLARAEASHALIRITNDRGGQIGRYVDRYEKLRASGQAVVIDGLCASACTIVLGTIPNHKICVTPNAELGFHAAWDFGKRGRVIPNPEATRELLSMYPSQVRRWIASRGGLSARTIFLRGRQLVAMYRACYEGTQAATTRRIEGSVLNNPARRERPARAAFRRAS